GGEIAVKGTTLPRTPPGYHKLLTRDYEALVISAPTKTYSDPEMNRAWGIFAPTYALHSEGNPSAGTFAEWHNIIDWLQPLGAKVVATLPLLASFMGRPVCE